MTTLALESHYWDSHPHRPACITVRDDIGRLYTFAWNHGSLEEPQHQDAVRLWLREYGYNDWAHNDPYSARWRTGWRHVVVLAPEDIPC